MAPSFRIAWTSLGPNLVVSPVAVSVFLWVLFAASITLLVLNRRGKLGAQARARTHSLLGAYLGTLAVLGVVYLGPSLLALIKSALWGTTSDATLQHVERVATARGSDTLIAALLGGALPLLAWFKLRPSRASAPSNVPDTSLLNASS